MDTATLVNEQIEDGKRLIDHLKHEGFPVAVAIWVQKSYDGLWFLYIASEVVNKEGPARAYSKIDPEFMLRVPSISRSDIKLIGPDDPIAVEAIKYRHDTLGTKFGGRKLGSLIIEDAYIYPS